MSHKLITIYCLLITVLSSCTTQTPSSPPQASLYVYRFNPPALIEFSQDLQIIGEIPFSIPPHCVIFDIFSAPIGKFLAIELSCSNGQTVLFLDASSTPPAPLSASSAFVMQPIQDSDSHFLAWTPDGKSIYLKVDSLGAPHVIRVHTDGTKESIPISEFTYDLATSGTQGEFTFTFSRGLGQGSELNLAQHDGHTNKVLYADPYNYISFARFSPDGTQIAFIKIPDTSTPFTVGELWVMSADGSNAHKLADADAGHGYTANWSPDGKRIAFVVRENPGDERADQSSDTLISNLYIVDVESSALTQITDIENGHTETPVWSPDGNTLAFNVVLNDRMEVQIADLRTGRIRSLIAESTCCPAWMRK
jgi:dipeptidyl aminopeptidase/acylaminoacyl peptidase